MNFNELSLKRFSCRKYTEEIPSRDVITQLLQQTSLAPSACNKQPWHFIVITPEDAAGRKAVIDSYSRQWIETAPYYIIMCGVPAQAWVRPHDGKNHVDVDVSIATEHLCLAAADMGLGTCWVCNFDPAVLTAGLELPEELVPVAIVPVGFPATEAPAKTRKDLNEITTWR